MLNAAEIIQKLCVELGTLDVFEIARRRGVKIEYAAWYPATIGEYDKKKQAICVNRRALAESNDPERLEKEIIAHELGHFLAGDFFIDRQAEELFAVEFAGLLLKTEN